MRFPICRSGYRSPWNRCGPGDDAGYPQERIVVVGGRGNAAARGAEKSVQSAGTVTEAFAPLNRVSSYPYIQAFTVPEGRSSISTRAHGQLRLYPGTKAEEAAVPSMLLSSLTLPFS